MPMRFLSEAGMGKVVKQEAHQGTQNINIKNRRTRFIRSITRNRMAIPTLLKTLKRGHRY